MTPRDVAAGGRPPLVLGLGNVLFGDDGVGIAVARDLEAGRLSGRCRLPEDVAILDGGTLGLDLLPRVQDASRVVFIDAVDRGRPPGTVEVLSGPEVQASLGGRLSPHEVGLADLLAAARLSGCVPLRCSLIAIQPDVLELGMGLSEAVEAAVPLAVEAACQALAAPPD